MLQTDRYLKIQSIHSRLPWTDLEIISDASALAEDKFRGVAIDYLGRLRDRGASIATFEIYAPYWFLLDRIPLNATHQLSVASVVSAAAIIEVDNSVDDGTPPSDMDPIVLEQANYWGQVASEILGVRTNWTRVLNKWCVPRHGIPERIAPMDIPLRKNPFYCSAAMTYSRGSRLPAHAIAKLYTMALGAIDDILDLVGDFIGRRPNIILSALKLPTSAGVDELLYHVIRKDLLRLYCRSSIEQIGRAKLLADASGTCLLARTCEVYEEKFADLLPLVNTYFVGECAEASELQIGRSGT